MDDLTVGSSFGNYEIVEVRGRGGFATVYVARDVRPAMSRRVALKVLDDHLGQDPDFRERFSRESRMAANLDHPNIAPIYDAGELDGRFYMAMRLVDGIDLKARLQQGPLTLDECGAVVDQIASALDYAHGEGLIHRDVKPGNVLLDQGQTKRVYLVDFGITKDTSDGKEFTQTGSFIGTLHYAAPEQINGLPLDGRCDQYALGCLVYEALTTKPPFEGTLQAIIGGHLSKHPPRVSDAVPAVPAAVDAVVARAMAKSPADRFATCTEFAEALAAARSGRSPAVGADVTVASAELPVIPELGRVDPEATVVTEGTVLAGSTASACAGGATFTPEALPKRSVEMTPPGPPPPYVTAPGQVGPSGGPPSRSNTPVIAGVVAAVLVVAVIAAAFVFTRGGGSGQETFTTASSAATTPTSATDTTDTTDSAGTNPSTATTEDTSRFEGPSQTIVPTRVAAPLQAAPGVDGCGATTTYVAANMFDSDPTTAWRTEGDGTGRRITLNLGGETRVTTVGLINGMAKVDACDGTDRYFDQRRITSVEWTFDDGTTATQTLDPSTKTLQTTTVDAITTRVRLEIRSTTAPDNRDFTPISELDVVGVPAQG